MSNLLVADQIEYSICCGRIQLDSPVEPAGSALTAAISSVSDICSASRLRGGGSGFLSDARDVERVWFAMQRQLHRFLLLVRVVSVVR